VSAGAGGRPEAIKAIPVRHPGRWVSAVILVAIVGGIVYAFATAPLLHWEYVQNWFFSRRILDGLVLTLELTVVAMVIGVALGIVLAVMRLSPNPVVSTFSWLYIWFFRGTPVLVQLFFWYYIAVVFPHLTIGIPGIGPSYSADTNTLVTATVAAILGLGLNEAAYMSEIVRAGIISVDLGQTEAAQALGMTRLQTMRRIVLPQAMRVIIPPTGNETISMLKTTSLASVIAVSELLYSAQLIYDVNYKTIELLMVASIWYLIVTSVLTVGQYYIERHYARGAARELPPTPIQRLRRALLIRHVELPTPPVGPPPGSVGGLR
jgi:polar amino acid transport system permease protein